MAQEFGLAGDAVAADGVAVLPGVIDYFDEVIKVAMGIDAAEDRQRGLGTFWFFPQIPYTLAAGAAAALMFFS
ncbi:MAG: hypothetical protein GY869_27750 [Planctomycetes bacterium]|nr:hypothetical protein [Planctomycetota bacterium]